MPQQQRENATEFGEMQRGVNISLAALTL
ncbi:hypothetical protein FHW04_001400 [Pantoea sp. AN62]